MFFSNKRYNPKEQTRTDTKGWNLLAGLPIEIWQIDDGNLQCGYGRDGLKCSQY